MYDTQLILHFKLQVDVFSVCYIFFRRIFFMQSQTNQTKEKNTIHKSLKFNKYTMEKHNRKQNKCSLKRDCQTDTQKWRERKSVCVCAKRDMLRLLPHFHIRFSWIKGSRMVKQVKFIITTLLFMSSIRINSIDTHRSGDEIGSSV